jgi:hypothetical protein
MRWKIGLPMPRVFLLTALLLLTARLHAQEKPNSLTPQEIADGWILLFDGETTFGWNEKIPGVQVREGALLWEPGQKGSLLTTSEFADFDLKLEMMGDKSSRLNIGLTAGGGISMSIPSEKEWTLLTLHREANAFGWETKGRKKTGILGKSGRTGILLASVGGKQAVRVRNVKLRPLGLKSIFNGKDLTGWKEIPGHKSVFSVTPEGWLNVKNGNGDLQTEEKWGDFLLQIEVYSNGDHLNSGIFFRANPGLFWSGYEAQIRNQWQGDDRTKPVDYGTGAIYNRQPARKVVSSDREWFTMTVLAHGNHLAVWVNGYQTSDFMDTRPANEENARLGARTKAGVLSLQGHDPTTDLSFRNIRVRELP